MHLLVRENVIDFTKPFMNLGISILFKKPEVSNFLEKNNVSIVLLNLGLMQNPNRKHFTFVFSAQNQFVQTNIKNIFDQVAPAQLFSFMNPLALEVS